MLEFPIFKDRLEILSFVENQIANYSGEDETNWK
ncbi:hypothetical protein N752_03090 [Desulforamulus aquiferis]|nr:hypothetical protein N752_03090 [Desulforamulus aquiferis]